MISSVFLYYITAGVNHAIRLFQLFVFHFLSSSFRLDSYENKSNQQMTPSSNAYIFRIRKNRFYQNRTKHFSFQQKNLVTKIFLGAISGLAWSPSRGSLHSSGPQLPKQLAYASCLVASFPDIVILSDAQIRAK